MTKPCIICNRPVQVVGDPEIVACSNDLCILTVEHHISIHYQTEPFVSGIGRVNRNDFQDDVFRQTNYSA